MSGENQMRFDGWGNEVYCTPRKRGRPPFEWTLENSIKISMLLSQGWSEPRIARQIFDPRTGKPISHPTLKRHFRSELSLRDGARDTLFTRQLMQAFGQAEKGNVGAMRFFEKLVAKNDLMLADTRMRSGETRAVVRETSAEKLGKKQTSQQVADKLADGGGAWGDDLKPGAPH